MCGFFSFSTGMSGREIADLFGVSNLPTSEEDLGWLESYKFYPGSRVNTVSKNSPNRLVYRYWSMIPRWWKKDPYKVPFATFNARAEDLERKATYRVPWRQKQRCLIPANWFYEFETVEVEGEKKPKKVPYRVQVRGEKVIALAGLYEVWRDVEGVGIESCTMITCAAVAPLIKIHKRQPVVIEKDDWERWLDKETPLEEVRKMLRPLKDLEVEQIDEMFNKARADEVTGKMVGDKD